MQPAGGNVDTPVIACDTAGYAANIPLVGMLYRVSVKGAVRIQFNGI